MPWITILDVFWYPGFPTTPPPCFSRTGGLQAVALIAHLLTYGDFLHPSVERKLLTLKLLSDM